MVTDRPTNVLGVILVDSGASCFFYNISIYLALSSKPPVPLSEIHATFAVANGGELLVYG